MGSHPEALTGCFAAAVGTTKPVIVGQRIATGTSLATGTGITGSGSSCLQLSEPGGCRSAEPDGILPLSLQGKKKSQTGAGSCIGRCDEGPGVAFSTGVSVLCVMGNTLEIVN